MSKHRKQKHGFEVVLLDFGGVLIELTGVSKMIEWTNGRMTVDEIWSRWLASPTVRDFESGVSTPHQFASAMLVEFDLPVTKEDFIREFTFWPKGLFPGAIPLLESLAPSVKLASMSNTNWLHWDRMSNEMGLPGYFHHNFPSHQTGFLKPDRDAFNFVIDALGHPAERILFFDDNQINVDSASSCGMAAYKVCGVAELQAKIQDLGLIG